MTRYTVPSSPSLGTCATRTTVPGDPEGGVEGTA